MTRLAPATLCCITLSLFLALIVCFSNRRFIDKVTRPSLNLTRGRLRSSAHCFNSTSVTSVCIYENVLLLDREFWLIGDFQRINGSFHESRTTLGKRWKPRVLPISPVSLPDQVLNGVSVFFAPFYPVNVGHTILDTIYPVFLSLLKLDLGNASYHSFITSSRWADRWLRPIQSVFAGGELFFMNLAVPNMTIRKLVVGCGGFGSRTVQNNVIALDRGLDSFRRFRDRMFRRFGIIPRASFQQSIFHGIIVNNKRFSRLDRLNFLRFCKDISGRTLSFRWIDLASIPSYRSQLEIFSQSDIYISATGTGINHNIFLPDHSVVVNLGTPSLPYEFFENDRVIACCDWVRVLYYPSNASLAAYDIHIIAHLVTQSLSFLKNPRWYPVPAFESLSPVSRAFLTYCRNGSLACADFMRDTFDLRTACGESSYVGRFLFDGPGTKCRRSLEHAAPHCRFLRFDQIVCAD